MALTVDRSCYVLELSVGPGGSRWAELHAYSDPDHIQAWLESFCNNDSGMSAYHGIWYGATLGIWIVQRGDVVDFIDVHPFIHARAGEGGASAPLSDTKACMKVVREAVKGPGKAAGEAHDEDEEDDEDDDFDWDDYERVTLVLDWEAIAARLPPLKPPLLLPGQRTKTRHPKKKWKVDTYFEGDSILFGSYDEEAGEKLDPPFDLDIPDEDEDEDEEDEDEEDEDEES
jgi:hypothetical protein